MIQFEECTKIGKLGKPYGNKGAFNFTLDEEIIDIENHLDVFLIHFEGYLVPFFIEDLFTNDDKTGNVKFDHIRKPEETREFVNCEFYIENSIYNSIASSSDDFLLTDFAILDKNLGEIGRIVDFMDSKLNPLLVCEFNNNEFYIPYNNSIVLNIDNEKKCVETNIPEGLLDINE